VIDFSDHFTIAVRPGIMVWRDDQRFAASIDRFVINNYGEVEILEIKCPVLGYPKNFPTSVEEVKPRVILQVLFQLAISGLDSAMIGFWQPKKKFLFRIRKSEEFNSFFKRYGDRLVHWNKHKRDFEKNPFCSKDNRADRRLLGDIINRTKFGAKIIAKDFAETVLLPVQDPGDAHQKDEEGKDERTGQGEWKTETKSEISQIVPRLET
jgi:hypothetical protein